MGSSNSEQRDGQFRFYPTSGGGTLATNGPGSPWNYPISSEPSCFAIARIQGSAIIGHSSALCAVGGVTTLPPE